MSELALQLGLCLYFDAINPNIEKRPVNVYRPLLLPPIAV